MASMQPLPASDASTTPVTAETAIEHAKRAFALKKYEQAVQHYGTALELMTKEVGEDTLQIADLYFSYGRALLENAISQSSVLGKEETEDGREEEAPETGADGKGPILSFSGDAEDDDDDGNDDPAVDLFQQAAQDVAEADAEGDGDEEDENAEPEDDFNAAWEVLDLARAIYVKQADADEEIKLKLADTYITLGDVSLETEKFDQAITDYEAGLALKDQILPISSRHMAEAHCKLSIVLDLTPGRLAEAIIHAEKALESVESRLAELRDAANGQLPQPPFEALEVKDDPKGKGKAKATRLVRDDLVHDMSKSRLEAEIRELSGLKEDLALKVEELKTTPNESTKSSAPALAAQELDKELNTAALSSAPTIINDLTSMVKKKKKVPTDADGIDNSASKRKAGEDVEVPGAEKKARIDEADS